MIGGELKMKKDANKDQRKKNCPDNEAAFISGKFVLNDFYQPIRVMPIAKG